MERWDTLELAFSGKTNGNPFTDYDIKGTFSCDEEVKTVEGFYDGDGTYKIRFMPSFEGKYSYRIFGSFSEKEYEGDFTVETPSENNHGTVRVKNKFHFAYDDGTPYYSIGTTCYVWHLKDGEMKKKTLSSLEKAGFNKIRFCVFPKHYCYNTDDPEYFPFEGTPMDAGLVTKENFFSFNPHSEGNNWDFERFNPEYFRNIEYCISELRRLGIEADIILFHPYDRWGFSVMDNEADIRYLKYVIARFSAYRNVWWSLANEYDYMPEKTVEHWDEIGNYIMANDPYGHLRSIHNGPNIYDHTKPWVTHCSIQRCDMYKTAECTDEYRQKYQKPVVLDEIVYEGNIKEGWGNIAADEMVRRFWEAVCRGGYPGHGETYMSDDDILWWSHGGILKGESHKRVQFLLDILKEIPCHGLRRNPVSDFTNWDCVCAVPENDEDALQTGYHLYYFGFMQPSYRDFNFGGDDEYSVEIIDTMDMTITYAGKFKGYFKIELPAKKYIAIRIQKVM